jgi:carnitine O-acetyltransferase
MQVARSMFRFQNQLPKLPVPELRETCQLYLQSVKPHATPAEFQKTQAAVTEFLAPNSMGHVLQQRLLERASAKKESSWLIEWWNDYAYMSYRDPLVIWVSYFFGILHSKI